MAQGITRRDLLVGIGASAGLCAIGGASLWIGTADASVRLPGGQDENRFLANCLRCDRCRSVCPQDCVTIETMEDGILVMRTPRLDFTKGYCTFCDECIAVCPTRALLPFNEKTEAVGLAVIDEDECLAFTKGACRVCADICEYGAIEISSANVPVVSADKCNGCGRCEFMCPSATYGSYSGGNHKGIYIVASGSGADNSSGKEG